MITLYPGELPINDQSRLCWDTICPIVWTVSIDPYPCMHVHVPPYLCVHIARPPLIVGVVPIDNSSHAAATYCRWQREPTNSSDHGCLFSVPRHPATVPHWYRLCQQRWHRRREGGRAKGIQASTFCSQALPCQA